MSIHIAPKLEAELQKFAAREAVSIDEIAARALAEWLEDQEDIAIAEHRLANPLSHEPYPTLDNLRDVIRGRQDDKNAA